MRRSSIGLLGLLALLAVAAGKGSHAHRASFTNPVYRHDFPDPFVLRVGKSYYAYGTQTGSFNIPVLTSTDLVHWKGPTEALPGVGPWSLRGLTWAPSVLRRSDGRYVMYFASRDKVLSRQCIGEAVSSRPVGPFVDSERHALICPGSLGGAIDPSVLRDVSGKLYLYWKNDGNCCGMTTHIFAQALSADGLHVTGKPVSLAINDQRWEGAVIEGPTMWNHGKTYFLFYSGGDYFATIYRYAVGYSRCTSPLGPCTEYKGNPILKSACRAADPGGEAIIQDAGGATWMVYHAWLGSHVNSDPGRLMWLDRLLWRNDRPVVAGPTCSPQHAPAT